MKIIYYALGGLALSACGAAPAGVWDGRSNLCPHPAPVFDSCSAGRGSVALAVCGDLQADNTLTIGAGGTNLLVGGDCRTAAPVQLGGDAMVAGTLDAENTVSVAGTLSIAAKTGAGAVSAGQVVTGPVLSPLNCAEAPRAGDLIAEPPAGPPEAPVPRAGLAHVSRPTEVELGCGRYHFDSIESDNTLAIHVAGPTVLVVDGDVHIAAPTTIDLADGASLEWIIGGSLQIDNTLRVGDSGHSASIALGGALRIAAPTEIHGTLIAPDSAAAADNTLDLWGAMMTHSLRIAAPLVVHDGPSMTASGCTP